MRTCRLQVLELQDSLKRVIIFNLTNSAAKTLPELLFSTIIDSTADKSYLIFFFLVIVATICVVGHYDK